MRVCFSDDDSWTIPRWDFDRPVVYPPCPALRDLKSLSVRNDVCRHRAPPDTGRNNATLFLRVCMYAQKKSSVLNLIKLDKNSAIKIFCRIRSLFPTRFSPLNRKIYHKRHIIIDLWFRLSVTSERHGTDFNEKESFASTFPGKQRFNEIACGILCFAQTLRQELVFFFFC